MHRLEMISSQKLWTLKAIDFALDCASKRKETEVSAFLMNERANLVDNQTETTEKSLNRRNIIRKKKFEL